MNLIMIGAPGAGKGTQAQVLKDIYKIPTISTGAIIRGAIENETKIGKVAKDYIQKGLLLPDETVIEIVKERLSQDDCKNGFILDGFPRTIIQAQTLDSMGVKIDAVINVNVDDSLIIERLSNRRECPNCAKTYHLINRPSSKGDKCEDCNITLIQRKDDNEETIKSRLEVYHSQTEALIEYYDKKGILLTVDGSKKVDEITKSITDALSI